MQKSFQNHNNRRRVPWIVGHRGSLYQELDNTREGFQQCARMGCDAVELDVFLLKCETLIVFRGGGTDERPGLLEEYCGVHGSILDYTYIKKPPSTSLSIGTIPSFHILRTLFTGDKSQLWNKS
jgi:glycerophosphoryl diester phosphodiesterase